MLHIVFLSPHSDPEAHLGEPDSGGQCIYELQLGTALSGLPDIKVTTFCRQTFHRPDTSIINSSHTIRRIHCGPDTFIPKEEIEQYLLEFVTKVQQELKMCAETDTFIFHAHYWDGGLSALWLKNQCNDKIPLIWTPHSLGTLKRSKFLGEKNEDVYNFVPRLCWESYTSIAADTIILSSESEKQALIDQYAVSAEKIVVNPPGVDFTTLVPSNRTKARQALGLPAAGRMLLCLGRMTRSKGYDRAIKALRALQAVYSETIYLVICGGSATSASTEETVYLRELKQLTAELKVEKDVVFHPAVPHHKINLIFSAADIFLMPSQHEPFGLVIIEAMGMKIPVVASNVGGPAAIIQHTQTGILVNFNDAERVASSIMALLKDTFFYTKIAAAAAKYARKNFDWYHKAARFSQVYRSVSRLNQPENFHRWVESKFFLQQYFKV